MVIFGEGGAACFSVVTRFVVFLFPQLAFPDNSFVLCALEKSIDSRSSLRRHQSPECQTDFSFLVIDYRGVFVEGSGSRAVDRIVAFPLFFKKGDLALGVPQFLGPFFQPPNFIDRIVVPGIFLDYVVSALTVS